MLLAQTTIDTVLLMLLNLGVMMIFREAKRHLAMLHWACNSIKLLAKSQDVTLPEEPK